MKTAKKKQCILFALASVPGTVWVEDLYLLLVRSGQRINIRTVYDAVRTYEAIGLVHCSVENRRTMVSLCSI